MPHWGFFDSLTEINGIYGNSKETVSSRIHADRFVEVALIEYRETVIPLSQIPKGFPRLFEVSGRLVFLKDLNCPGKGIRGLVAFPHCLLEMTKT